MPEDGRPRLNPFALGKKTEEIGAQWSEENERASFLEDMKEVILARLILEILDEKPGLSHAKATELAKASAAYEAHLRGKNEARKIANKTKYRIAGYDVYVRISQSVDATTRTLIQRGVFPS